MAMIPARPYSHFHIEKNRFLLYIYKVPLKIRLKIIKFTCLCVFTMVMSVCVQPVDVGSFMNNDRVVDQVEKGAGRVIIGSGSDTGLSAGNGRISGLNPSKYYRVEELEGNGTLIDTYFVTNRGTLDEKLENIVKGVSQINGLTNNTTYRVKSAKEFTSGSYAYFKLSDTNDNTKAQVSSGTVTIYPSDNTNKYYLNLASVIDPTKNYEVMKVNIKDSSSWAEAHTSAYRTGNSPDLSSGIGDNTNYTKYNTDLSIGIYEFVKKTSHWGYENNIIPSFLENMSIIELPASDTENDYVFVQYTNKHTTGDFWVLKVIIKPPLGSGNLSITDISGAPTDIVYTIQEVGTSGNFALTGNASTGFVISLSKALTQPVVTINLTTTGITTVGWQNGQGTLLAGATAGQINYTINVSNFTAKNTSVSVVFTRTSDSAPLATAPITIRFTDF